MKKQKLFENVSGNQFKLTSEEHDETDMTNPEESREVQIGKGILANIKKIQTQGYDQHIMTAIERLATDLIQMHTKSSGNSSNKPLSGWDTLQLGSH